MAVVSQTPRHYQDAAGFWQSYDPRFVPADGGLTTLGLNTCIMAFPAVAAHYGLRLSRVDPASPAMVGVAGILGALAIVLASIILAAILSSAGEAFTAVAWTVLVAHVPIVVLEGTVTAVVVGFLQKVCPELLAGAAVRGAPATGENDTCP